MSRDITADDTDERIISNDGVRAPEEIVRLVVEGVAHAVETGRYENYGDVKMKLYTSSLGVTDVPDGWYIGYVTEALRVPDPAPEHANVRVTLRRDATFTAE